MGYIKDFDSFINEEFLLEGRTLFVKMKPIANKNDWKKFVDEVKELIKNKRSLASGSGWEYELQEPIVNYDKIEINGKREKSGEAFVITPTDTDFFVKTYGRPYEQTIRKILNILKKYTEVSLEID